ncbi:MAG: 1,4-alpha-glucan branching protein domain-containing protein, partial [Gemmatimonadales bacterium]
GRASHARHFGELPRGCWVPECAYRPAGPWQPIAGVRRQPLRVGIEDHLRYAGFQWFYVDAHLVEAGESYDQYTGLAHPRVQAEAQRSPHRSYQVGYATRGRPINVLVRDPATTAQVWSRHGGYPGDGNYLEFHKIRSPGGLKLWRVTDSAADLGAKAPYQPAWARDSAARHAMHFRELLDVLAAGAAAGEDIVVAPFDTELFGHWWFEGMEFLKNVYEDLAVDTGVTPLSSGAALAASPPTESLRLTAGSWGKDGDFSMWLNPETEWLWERLWPLEDRFWNAVPAAMLRRETDAVLEQAARELLLAQSSDWQFIVSTGAAGDYAIQRFNEHCDALESLLPFLEDPSSDLDLGAGRAAEYRALDGLFADLLGAIAAASDVPAP